MSLLIWHSQPPALRAPVLVAAFKGWFDAGSSATGAIEWLNERGQSARVAHIDPEELFNFGEQRPRARIVDGRHQTVWPANEVHALPCPGASRDLISEPSSSVTSVGRAMPTAALEASQSGRTIASHREPGRPGHSPGRNASVTWRKRRRRRSSTARLPPFLHRQEWTNRSRSWPCQRQGTRSRPRILPVQPCASTVWARCRR